MKKWQPGGKKTEVESSCRGLRGSERESQKGRGCRADKVKVVEWYCKAADSEQMEGAGGCD